MARARRVFVGAMALGLWGCLGAPGAGPSGSQASADPTVSHYLGTAELANGKLAAMRGQMPNQGGANGTAAAR
jgi:hypothetical protein